MALHWLIQCTDLPLGWHEAILAAVESRGLPWSPIGLVRDPNDLEAWGVTGLPDENWRERSLIGRPLRGVFWGSTILMQAAAGDLQRWIQPGTWWQAEWWNPIYQEQHPRALNGNGMLMEAWHLKHDVAGVGWVTEPTFVKSVRPKVLTGQVLEPGVEDRDRWRAEHKGLADDELVYVVEACDQPIDLEVRWFVVAGEVITGSTYRVDGGFRQRVALSEEAWSVARTFAKQWLPCPNCTMDVCQLRDCSWRVVEFNCLTSSGFYGGHDAGLVVDAIEQEFAGEVLG